MDQNLTIFLAPFLIIVGGGLVAFGGLTLFGLDLLFKTRKPSYSRNLCWSGAPWRAGNQIFCVGRIIFRKPESRGFATVTLSRKLRIPASEAPKAMLSTGRLPRV